MQHPRRLRMVLALAGALALPVALLAAAPGAPQATDGQRTIFVSVLDDGEPVTDLTAADFTVRENGEERTVVAAGPPNAPLTVALLIDDSGLGLQSMREGAAAFVNRLTGRAFIAVITTGGRNILVQDFTSSTAQLMASINKVYARNVTGAFLTDGIVEIAAGFARNEAERTAIVSMGVEGEDFSEVRPNDVLAALQRSRTRLYMVRLGTPVIGRSNPLSAERGESLADEMTRFNAVLGQAPPRSGGRIEQLVSHTGIPRTMEEFATELAWQYEVTYATPAGQADVRLEVGTTRDGLRVQAPQRVGAPR